MVSKVKIGILIVGILLFGLVQFGLAQEPEEAKELPTIKLEEITVKGTKITRPMPMLPLNVNILTRDKMLKTPATTVDEVLKSLPSITRIRSGPAEFGVFVNIRGHGLMRSIIALDGQPMNDFMGYVRMSVVPDAMIDRVEVIRGPASALYGPLAMTGVINLIPRTYLERNELRLRAGSFGNYSGCLTFGTRLKDLLSLLVSVEEKNIYGNVSKWAIREPVTTRPTGVVIPVTGWERTSTPTGKLAYKIGELGNYYSVDHRSLNVNLLCTPTPKTDISLSFLYGTQTHGWKPGMSYLRDDRGRPVESGNVEIVDEGKSYYITISPRDFLAMHGICGQHVMNVKASHKLSDLFKLKLSGGFNTRFQEWAIHLAGATSSGGPGRKTTIWGIAPRISAETDVNLQKYKTTLIVGSELNSTYGYFKREKVSNWTDLRSSVREFEDREEGKSQLLGMYFLNEFIPIEKLLTIWAGARYDFWRNYDGKQTVGTGAAQIIRIFPEKTASLLSPKLGVAIKPIPFITLRSSYGKGFKMPTIAMLYRQVITPVHVLWPNPELKPEYNTCYEIGLELSHKPLLHTLKMNYFIDDAEDLIYIKTWTAPHPDDPTIMFEHRRRENAAKARTSGLEVEIYSAAIPISLPILPKFNLSWFGNITLQQPRITENPVEPVTVDKVIPHTPTELYNIGLTLEKGPVITTLSAHRRSKMYARGDNTDTTNFVQGSFDPFTVMDAKLSYKVNNDFTVSATLNNLLNERYFGGIDGDLCAPRSITLEASYKF